MDLLTQAYLNNWTLYERALRGSPSLRHWDLCVLTAANERQARAYEMQVKERQEIGALPPNMQWLVVPDPEGGVRIGSGGATFHVLLRILQTLEPGLGRVSSDRMREVDVKLLRLFGFVRKSR